MGTFLSALLVVGLLGATAHATPWMVVDPNQGSLGLSSGATGAEQLSGLTWIGSDQYLAVSDQTARMYPMTIGIDPANGRIAAATLGNGILLAGSDLEDIAFHPPTGSVLVCDEVGPQIRRHALADGQLLETLSLPAVFANVRANLSLEALTWDDANGFLWTANEEALSVDGPASSFTAGTFVRLQRFDATFTPNGQWAYETDPLPGDILDPGRDIERSGVVALIALPDGELIVLERALGAGAILRHRLYQVDFGAATDTSAVPALDVATFTPVAKTLLWSRVVGFTNLEGAALGPTLDNGSLSLVLIADNGSGFAQALYPLTLRPIECGDGFVGGDEECDDGNLASGDGCTSACTQEFCGDGIINNGGDEACDDGDLADGDGCSAVCGFEREVRLCQEAIAKGGRGFAEARIKALHGCRNQLNRGKELLRSDGVTVLAGPEECDDERRTALKLRQAGTKFRTTVAKRCTDAEVAVLAACAATLDGLVAAGGESGCLVDTHVAATDALVADQYGDVVPPTQRDLRRCQEFIAKSGLKYARLGIAMLQSCRNQMNRGKEQFLDQARTQRLMDPAACANELRTARKRQRAQVQLRAAVAKACTDALAGTLASTCASTVDGLVTADAAGGCLVAGHDAAVTAMLEAQYRPANP